jgi:rhodanese-related sulfurtransferase
MSNEIKFDYVTPEELSAWMEDKKSFLLIHTLTGIHFQKVHLPGAHHACVFEVTFLDQIKSITADKNAQIVLYGSSERSMDALTAAEKLKLDGYQQITILKGGIESWRTLGYSLEGESVESGGDSETRLLLPEGEYHIDTDALVSEAHFDIDRTRWNVIYGSTRFFENLGMHLVFDLISFQVRIVARN